jgi:dihydroorotate dehydrogenase (fumarate)
VIDLSTEYLGLRLPNPLVASASPLSRHLSTARRLQDAGIAAIVMYSLFEEQILHETLEFDHYLERGSESFAEARSYLPDGGLYRVGPEKYLDQVALLKKELTIPVIASLNGVSTGGWTAYARRMEEAGADALELNLYYVATDPQLDSRAIEDRQIDLVAAVRSAIRIALAVKISPFVTGLANFTGRLVEAGANAVVLFNRFYQPDLDLEALEIVHSLDLSTSAELRLPLRWVSILHGRFPVDIALTGGVHTHHDVLKAMMAGARVAMLASELLARGPSRVGELLSDLVTWMTEHEYASIQQMTGSMSQRAVREPAAFERANYMKVLSSYRELP